MEPGNSNISTLHDHDHDKKTRGKTAWTRHVHQHNIETGKRITWAGIGINGVLIVLKVLGAVYGHSRALLADAIHSISDFLSDILVLIGLHFFGKDKDINQDVILTFNGFNVYRFTETEINKSPRRCINKISKLEKFLEEQ